MEIDPDPQKINDQWDYYNFYSDVHTHRIMLKDRVRTNTYRIAIESNQHLIKDKIIMDVGCGTGILSLFAARTGAKKVLAIECSDFAQLTSKIVKANKYEDIITVIHSKLEDITQLPHGIEKVDVIISEFMGYSLVTERMIEPVLIARDRWLKRGGKIFPDFVELFVFGVNDARYLDNYVQTHKKRREYGHLESFRALSLLSRIPHVRHLDYKKNVLTYNTKILQFNLNTVELKNVQVLQCKFVLKSKEQHAVVCHGIGTYFDVTFTACHKLVRFSTAPWCKYTHWGQTVFYFQKDVKVDSGDELKGFLAYRPNPQQESSRDVQFSIEVSYNGRYEKFFERNVYAWIVEKESS